MATRRISRTARALLNSNVRPQTLSSSRISPNQIRTLFKVPALKNDEKFSTQGCSRQVQTPEGPKNLTLYSGAGYRMAWTTHQTHLLYNLNYLMMNKPESQFTDETLAVAKRHARDPAEAVLFNHASQAHNNHFFFESISDTPTPLSDFPGLEGKLIKDFGSIDALRDMMRYTADGIFGSGFVWLVWVKNSLSKSKWRVLATYNAGTPYVVRSDGSADRNQSRDMNNVSPRIGVAQNPLGGATEVCPVLCLSVWEHSFIRDFSVHGKRDFVDTWWEFIDWQKVEARAPGDSKEVRWMDEY